MAADLPAQASPSRHYAVFISYRHADNQELGRQWASWLHQTLETFEVPEDLIGTTNSRRQSVPSTLYPVFRDEEELPADSDLTQNIRTALENSGLLVVICSPGAVASRFVADEIRYFKEIGKADRILALIIDGEPNASDDLAKINNGLGEAFECFPQPLRFGLQRLDGAIDWSARAEPIAADARPNGKPNQGWTNGAAYREQLRSEGVSGRDLEDAVKRYEERLELAKMKVIAGALALPLGILTQRDKVEQLRKAQQRARALRRWLAVVGLFLFLAIIAAALAFQKQREAIAAEKRETAQRLAAEANLTRSILQRAASHLARSEPELARPLLKSISHARMLWEWRFLMAWCGPTPVQLDEIAPNIDFGGQIAELRRRATNDSSSKAGVVTTPTTLIPLLSDIESGSIAKNQNVFGVKQVLGGHGSLGAILRINPPGFIESFKTGSHCDVEACIPSDDGTVVYFQHLGEEGRSWSRRRALNGGLIPLPDVVGISERLLNEYESWGEADASTEKKEYSVSAFYAYSPEYSERTGNPTQFTAIAKEGMLLNEVWCSPSALKRVDYRNFETRLFKISNGQMQVSGDEASTINEDATKRHLTDLAALDLAKSEVDAMTIGPSWTEDGERRCLLMRKGLAVLECWDLKSKRVLWKTDFKVFSESIEPDAEITKGDRRIAFWYPKLEITSLRDGSTIVSLENSEFVEDEHGSAARCLLSPDGRYAAMYAWGRLSPEQFVLWNAKTGKLIAEKSIERERIGHVPRFVSWERNGLYVAVQVADEDEVRIYRQLDGEIVKTLTDLRLTRNWFNPQPVPFVINEELGLIWLGRYILDAKTWETLLELPDGAVLLHDWSVVALPTPDGRIEFVHPVAVDQENNLLEPKNLREFLLYRELRTDLKVGSR